MLRWVFIEIELDLFVGYKTFFAFVLATDAVGHVSVTCDQAYFFGGKTKGRGRGKKKITFAASEYREEGHDCRLA